VKATLLAIVIGLGAVAQVPAQDAAKVAAAGPRIRVEPVSFDFGRAAQNKTLERQFSIRNFGDKDLAIESVSTTCGCTAALLDDKDKVVKPGGAAPLRVTLETRNYKGRVMRSVMIRSNDTETPLLEVKVEATVEAAEK
jgi:hypothetical protein